MKRFIALTSDACPFCSGTYSLGTTSDNIPAAAHSKPPCKKFLECADALDFAVLARKAPKARRN